MPGPPIDNVLVGLEVLVVTDAAVRVGQHQVGGSVDGGQPAEEGVICSGGVLLGGPITGAVERIGDDQFPSVEVCAEDKRDVLHPADDGAGLRSHLGAGSRSGGHTRQKASLGLTDARFWRSAPDCNSECSEWRRSLTVASSRV